MYLYCHVLRQITPAVCRMRAKQDGLRYAPFLFRHGSGSPLERSQMPYGYRALQVHFGIARFFMAIPTRIRAETTESAYTKRSAASGGRFFRYRFIIRYDTAGSTLGAARPQTCAKEPLALWTLFTLGRVMLAEIRFVVIRVHGKTRLSPICARAGRAV